MRACSRVWARKGGRAVSSGAPRVSVPSGGCCAGWVRGGRRVWGGEAAGSPCAGLDGLPCLVRGPRRFPVGRLLVRRLWYKRHEAARRIQAWFKCVRGQGEGTGRGVWARGRGATPRVGLPRHRVPTPSCPTPPPLSHTGTSRRTPTWLWLPSRSCRCRHHRRWLVRYLGARAIQTAARCVARAAGCLRRRAHRCMAGSPRTCGSRTRFRPATTEGPRGRAASTTTQSEQRLVVLLPSSPPPTPPPPPLISLQAVVPVPCLPALAGAGAGAAVRGPAVPGAAACSAVEARGAGAVPATNGPHRHRQAGQIGEGSPGNWPRGIAAGALPPPSLVFCRPECVHVLAVACSGFFRTPSRCRTRALMLSSLCAAHPAVARVV